MTTPYEFLIESLDYITHIETRTTPLAPLNMTLLRVSFLENYLDLLLNAEDTHTENPLQYPDGPSQLLFHMHLMTQMEKTKGDAARTEKMPHSVSGHCTRLIDIVGKSLDCKTRAEIDSLTESYRALRAPPTLRNDVYPILKHAN